MRRWLLSTQTRSCLRNAVEVAALFFHCATGDPKYLHCLAEAVPGDLGPGETHGDTGPLAGCECVERLFVQRISNRSAFFRVLHHPSRRTAVSLLTLITLLSSIVSALTDASRSHCDTHNLGAEPCISVPAGPLLSGMEPLHRSCSLP